MTELLDAVDALTNPDVLTRFTGTDHDHEWLDLHRDTTTEERAAQKLANSKIPKMQRPGIDRNVKTGELWCPWCDTVVWHRPDEPRQEINRHDDPPLLEQLESRIGSTLGDRGTSGARVGGSPIDLSAFMLYTRIDTTVREWLGNLKARPGSGITLTHLLRSWYTLRNAATHPVGEDDIYRMKLVGWETEIRDILDPPEQIPYRGQACPVCGQTRGERVIAGDVEETVALWAFLRPAYRSEGSYGMCRLCETVLARDADPILLRQKMNGTIATGRIGFAYQTSSEGDES